MRRAATRLSVFASTSLAVLSGLAFGCSGPVVVEPIGAPDNVETDSPSPPSAPASQLAEPAAVDAGTGCAQPGTHWDHDENPSTPCVPKTTCHPGEYVVLQTYTTDRVCAPCPENRFSSGANELYCTLWTACPAGTEETAAATKVSPAICPACPPGTYCAGGKAPKEPCPDGTWDHDANPATACIPWTTCVPGQLAVTLVGSATTNRTCIWCPGDSYSTTENATSCTARTACAPGSYAVVPSTPSTDRVCGACPEVTDATVPGVCFGPMKSITAGWGGTCGVLANGTVRCWGNAGDVFSPAHAVPELTGAKEIALGGKHACAVIDDGTVQCWGANWAYQLGDNTRTNRTTPAPVPGLTQVLHLSAMSYGLRTLAVRSDGSVLHWGSDDEVLNTANHTPVPTLVEGFTNMIEVAAAGEGWIALQSSGAVLSSSMYVPALQTVMSPASRIAASSAHQCAVLPDKTVRCWGRNKSGQLGNGTGVDSTTPQAVEGLTDVAAIAVGSAHTCALLMNGTVSCWGYNAYGMLGDGTTTNRLKPTPVLGLTGVTALSLGYAHSCALLSNGSAQCWGGNRSNELGDGTTIDRLVPVTISQ